MLRQFLVPVAGLSLGVSRSSLAQIESPFKTEAYGQGLVRTYINAVNGNYIVQEEGIRFVEAGGEMSLYFTYNHQVANVADKWHLSIKRIKSPLVQGKDLVLIEEDGAETVYSFNQQSHQYISPTFGDGTPYIEYSELDNAWVRYDIAKKTREYFNADGLLYRRENMQGKATQYLYDDKTKLLKEVVCTHGRSYQLRREKNFLSIYQVEANSETCLINYEFDEKGLLKSTETPDKLYKVNFGYEDATGYLIAINQTDQSNISIHYDHASIDPSKVRPNYIYYGDLRYNLTFQQEGMLKIEDSCARIKKIYVDAKTGLLSGFDQSIQYVHDKYYESTKYRYQDGQLIEILGPNGGLTKIDYKSAYDKLFSYDRIHKITRPDGQVSEFFYIQDVGFNQMYGKVNYVLGLDGKPSVPAATFYAYDLHYDNALPAGKPVHAFMRFEISPEGRVTEYIPDKDGNIGIVKRYLNARFNQKISLPILPLGCTIMQKWVDQQNKQDIEVTELQYDDRGQVIRTVRYANVDANGNGIKDDGMQIIDTQRDAHGNIRSELALQQKIAGKDVFNNATAQYDSVQRLLHTIDGLHSTDEQKSIIEYNDQALQLKSTNQDGLVNVGQFQQLANNRRGYLTSEQKTGLDGNGKVLSKTTSYARWSTGEITLTTQPDGSKTYTFYDQKGNLTYSLSPTGRVTEKKYSDNGRVLTTIKYANVVDVASCVSKPPVQQNPRPDFLQTQLKKVMDPARDRYDYAIHDTSGRLRFEIDADGYVVETIYDSRDKIIAKINYDSVLADQLSSLKSGEIISLSFNPMKDRCVRTIYDLDGLVVGEQDAAGYVTEFKRNAAGWIIEKIVYDTKQKIITALTSIDAIRPVDVVNASHTRYFHDHRGQVILEIDAEGFATSKSYLPNGKVFQARRHIAKVSEDWLKNPVGMPKLVQDDNQDFISSYQYDVLGREIFVSDNTGKAVATTYDKMDRIIGKQTYDLGAKNVVNGDLFRGIQTRYDQFGQITHEANAFMVEMLAKVDADSTLTTEQKQSKKESIWQQFSTRHFYNDAGLRIATAQRHNISDQKDHMTYFYYDEEHRPVINISVMEDGTTRITEDVLNRFDEAELSRRYSQSLPVEVVNNLRAGLTTAQIKSELIKIQNDKLDAITQKKFDNRGNTISIIDPEGYEATKQYNAFKQCSEETQVIEKGKPPIEINHKFEARGLEIETTTQKGDLKITVKREFENALGKKTSETDEGTPGVLRVTKMEQDRLGRDIKVTDPNAVVIKQVEYDALNRPKIEKDAFLNETVHSYNTKERAHTIAYPDNGTKETIINNIFGEKVTHKDALGNAEVFEHASDGQVSKYTDALNNSTLDEYNLSGWHVSHQNKRQTKTEYTKNNAGETIKTVEDVNRLKLTTTIQRNALGHQTLEVNPKGTLIQFEPDKNGRILSSVVDPVTEKNPAGLDLRTNNQYNGLSAKTAETKSDAAHPEKFETSYQQDDLGRAIGQIVDPNGPLKLKNQKVLSNANKIICRIDANGNETHIFYDKNDRKRFVINACGGIIEREYDLNGNISSKREYETSLTQAELDTIKNATLTDEIEKLVTVKRSLADSIDRKFYDKNGKKRFSIEVVWNEKKRQLEGIVTEKGYDIAGRRIKETVYAQAIDVTNLKNVTTDDISRLVNKVHDPLHDKITRFILDSAGQECFLIDPENYLVEQRFNPMGEVIEKINYAARVSDPDVIANLLPEQVLSKIKSDSKADSVHYYVFDSMGRPLFVVSPEGAVIEYYHDQNGNETCEHHYADRIPMPQKDYESLQQAVYKLAEQYETNRNPNDRIIRKGYDAADRQISETDAENHKEQYGLNPLGDRESLIDKNSKEWKTSFDTAGRGDNRISPKTTLTDVTQDANGKLSSTKSEVPQAVVENTVYDNMKNPKEVIRAKGLPTERKVKTGYNKLNMPISTTVEQVAVDNGSSLDPKNPMARPETTVSVTSRAVYNAKKLKVVEIDEAGNPSFTIYDERKQPIYEINAAGAIKHTEYNAAGDEVRVTQYANKFSLDLKSFIETGIPRSVVEINLKADAVNDVVVEKLRNKRGDLVKLRRGPLFHYSPESVSEGFRPVAGLQTSFAETDYEYNALGIQVKESSKLDANRRSSRLIWADRCGKKVAEAEAVEVKDGVTWYRPSAYVNNTFGECEDERHYANKVKDPSHMSLSVLQDSLTAIQDEMNDHHTQKQFDRNGLTLSEINKNEIFHEGGMSPANTPLLNEKRDDLKKSFTRTATGKIASITYEDGSVEYKFYDERDYLIAETGVAITHPELPGQVLVPITLYGINAHGESIEVSKYKTGTKPVDPALGVPAPINPNHPDDQHAYELRDNRGQVKVKQDPKGNLSQFSSTVTKQPARQWHVLSNWNEANINELVKFVDEKYFHQDELNETIGVEVRRNAVTTEQTWIMKDIFGRHIGEGSAPDKFHIIRKFDALGNAWFTNEEKGINTVTLTDLTGKRTLQLRCASIDPTKDLSEVSYAQLVSILNWKEIEKTEIQRDLAGRPVSRTEPAEMIPDPDAVLVMPINMFVENTADNRTILSWPVPQEGNIHPQVIFQARGTGADKKIGPFSNEIIKNNDRYELDVTDLASDVYDFTMMHIDNVSGKQRYVSQGEIQWVTKHNDNSLNLVAVVKGDSQLELSGNTAGLTEIALFQDNIQVATIPLKDNQTVVDLKDYPSGVYQVKPLKGDDELALSLEVVIHTEKPSPKPLARELECDVSVKVDGSKFAFSWQCSDFFKDMPVKVYIGFTGADDAEQGIGMELSTAQNGAFIPVGVELKDVNSLSFSFKNEDGEWIDIYDQILPVDVKVNEDQIQDVSLGHRRILYVMPGQEKYQSDAIQYLDTNLDLMRVTKALNITSVTSKGFTVDVTDVAPGVYPYKWPTDANYSAENVLRVTRGGLVFLQALDLPPAATKKMQPLSTITFDNFDNPVETMNSLGDVTKKVFNHRNKQIKRIDPEVEIYKNDGTHPRGCPVFVNGFNRRGVAIGSIDQNGGVDLLILNEAGATIKKILPDGVVPLTQFFDVFGCVYEHWDSRRKSWKHLYDKNNIIIHTTTPMAKLIDYVNDELDHRIATTRSWNAGERPECNGSETHKESFDERGNVCAQIKPMGQITKSEWDRNHERVKQINPDHTTLIWKRDDFGNCYEHRDLGNILYQFFFDQMKQTYRKQSSTRPGETCLRSIPHTFENVTYKFDKKTKAPIKLKRLDLYSVEEFPTPAMDVEYVYRWGHVVQIIDHARNQIIDFKIDTEGDRLEVIIRQNGEIIRQLKVKYDALRRPIWQFDTMFELTTGFDACGNEVMNRGVLNVGDNQMMTSESWNLVDLARRVIVSDGVLLNGTISITNGRGVRLNYQDPNAPGYRSGETRIVNNKSLDSKISYNGDGLLSGIANSDGTFDNRIYNNSDHRIFIDVKDQSAHRSILTTENANGVPTRDKQSDGPVSDYTLNPVTDLLMQTKTQFNPGKRDFHNHTLTFGYANFDSKKVSLIKGHRTRYHVKDPIDSKLEVKYHASGALNARRGRMAAEGELGAGYGEPVNMYTSTDEGWILELQRLTSSFAMQFATSELQNKYKKFYSGLLNPYFHGVGGQLLAQYEIDLFNRSLGMKLEEYAKIRLNAGNGMGVGINGGYSFTIAGNGNTPGLNIASAVQSVSTSFPPPAPSEYIVVGNENFASIAQNMIGDSSLGWMIAKYNDMTVDAHLEQGEKILIPPLMVARKSVGVAAPYYKFVDAVLGNVMAGPSLPALYPDDDNGIGALLGVLAVGIALITAPYLAGVIFGVTTTAAAAAATGAVSSTGIAAMTATGVSAGLINASEQGLLMGMGVQKHFELENVLTSALSAGLAPAMGMPAGFNPAEYGTYMVKMGVMNAAEQLMEMAAGKRSQFDVKAMVTAMANSAASAAMNGSFVTNKFAQSIVNSVTDNAIASVIAHRRMNIDAIMQQAVGSSVLAVARDKVEQDERRALLHQQASTSRTAYHDAKQASRGSMFSHKPAKSMPTREQIANAERWLDGSEHDAAFDTVPSGRLDVSSEGIARARAGMSAQRPMRASEVVERRTTAAQHASVARNRSSFWQQTGSTVNNAVDDILNMRQGTLSAFNYVFTGREDYRTNAWQTAGFYAGMPVAVAASVMSGEVFVSAATELNAVRVNLVNRFGGMWSRSGSGSLASQTGEVGVATQTAHELQGLSPANVVRLADEIGLGTKRDQLILWSGLKGNGAKIAQEYARQNGGVTLEMTPGGKWLEEMDLFAHNSPFTGKEAIRIWGDVSALMLQRAQGQVRALLGQVHPDRVYRTYEITEAMVNQNVMGVDEVYLQPRFGFK